MAQMGQVDPDLMGATGFKVADDLTDKRFWRAKAFGDFVVGSGFPGSLGFYRPCHGNLDAVVAAPRQGRVDGPFARMWLAPDKGCVGPLQPSIPPMTGKLVLQLLQRWLCLCHDHDAAGLFVEAMDDARPQFAANAGEFRSTMSEEGIDEGSVRRTWGRVDDQARWFVDDQKMSVLVDDGQGNVFWLGGGCARGRQGDVIGLSWFDPVGDVAYRPLRIGLTCCYMSLFDQRANA